MSRRARFGKKMNVANAAKDRHTPAFAPQTAVSYPVWKDSPRTMDWVKEHYGPPRTLGVSDDVFMAMDAQLENAGVYTLLQHSLQHGQSVYPEFVGYGALQGMSQNGLIRACIETVCDDMTRNWIALKGGDAEAAKDDEKSVVEEITASLHALNIQNSIHHACELVGYEGGAFIYIDTGASTEDMEKPLNISPYSAELQPGNPLRFVVVDPINVFPGDYNSLYPLRKDYFNPAWWYVLGQKVHASRMIRLVANEVPILLKPAYNFLGLSQAQILWDYVLHFQECRAAEARLLTKFSMTVFKTKLMDTILSGGGVEQLDTRIRFMTQTMNNDGVLVVDNEREDVVKLETPLSGVTDIVRQALEFLAALNRTPAVKLLGISPSGFNATGESDIRNYYDHVASQQEKIIRKPLETILRCVQLHLYGALDKNITFDFNPLGQEDNAALAMQQKTRADTVAVYLDRDIISVEEARRAIAEDPDSGFYGIDPDDIPEGNPMPTGTEEMTPYGGGMDPGKNNDVDDVDKAGAVYDAALWGEDDEEWRTAKNGKHFEVDTETGEIIKGNVGQANVRREFRTLESTSPDTTHYAALLKEHGGNHVEAAKEFFRTRLQGATMSAKADGRDIQVHFTGGTWQEIKRGMRQDALKAELVPHMPDIISTGQYQKSDLYKDRTDKARAFYSYSKTIDTSQGRKEVIVDVVEREDNEPRYSAYNMTREGAMNFEARKERMAKIKKDADLSVVSSGYLVGKDSPPYPVSPGLIMDGRIGIVEDNIVPLFEVVNLRFADEAR